MDKKELERIIEGFECKENDLLQVKNQLAREIKRSNKKIIVLDDDPTGVQTVHDIYIYTDWSVESIRNGFKASEQMFYLLTNSRGLTETQTIQVHTKIIKNILTVSKETGQDFLIISRGDSTLRGHYPLETKVIRDILEKDGNKKIDGEILFPFFKEGGRLTVGDIHYVKDKDVIIPAGETEFAKDKTFGFGKSNLREYVEEKTNGEFKAETVTSIDLKTLRSLRIDEIVLQLLSVKDFNKVIVNALDYQDVEVFCTALYLAMGEGKNFLMRTAASFVKVMGGVSNRPLLTRKDMIQKEEKHGGFIVVGSHTAKTTKQLNELKQIDRTNFIEFNSDLVLEDRLEEEVERVLQISRPLIQAGITVVVYTKRKVLVLETDTPELALLRSVKISEAVQSLVARLEICPSFVVAKGGITSSDVGVKALKVKKALVLGQAAPGIPVWKTDENSRFPGIPYIIFPGNVGEDSTLKEVVKELMGN